MTDLRLAREQLQLAHDRFQAGRETLQEVCFWGKAVVSSLFGHMDAVGFTARKMSVLFRSMGGLDLTNKELAKLSEVRYDKHTDQLTQIPDLLNPLEGFKIGAKYFCRLVGTPFELAVKDERWKGVIDLWKARISYTHPKRIEDLYAVELFGPLKSSLLWYHTEFLRMFVACAKSTGLPAPETPSPSKQTPIHVSTAPMFTEGEFDQQIGLVGGRSLAYVTRFFQLLSYDSKRAALARKRVKRQKGDLSSFANRLLLRTECTQIEALLAAITFLLHAARRRKEIHFDDTELNPVPGLPLSVGALLAAVRIWSLSFGDGRQPNVTPFATDTIEQAWSKRNRLVHPRTKEDLELDSLSANRFALALLKLRHEAFNLLRVEEDKWMQAYERGLLARV